MRDKEWEMRSAARTKPKPQEDPRRKYQHHDDCPCIRCWGNRTEPVRYMR